ncbi:O-acetyl-ADP-ribose deacetylase [Paenibacillus chitinolyticus]|uniref:O-acetyl-ADP-ribose deacetylase n=1 Tax=Paenibacillus chitinolyticus TaxID=79263 RepID=UPI002DB761E7|nr:O-acetyl-ADP-ribose deacetylase [Paenibacillus chitinolyticus]MEC0246554.1 O-acetyl-ADP-ribose deacetylase [Paenibacillus chitinolyticus]
MKVNQTTLTLIKGDITKVTADVIVNAANTSLLGGGGVDGAIHRAGGVKILEECIKIRERQGGCPVGEAVLTTAGNLPASYVIHTVGPVWNGGSVGEADKLGSCYRNSLELADWHHAKSIAFPNISTGIYRFPKPLAADIALTAVKAYLVTGSSGIEHIYFVCFDEENYGIYKERLSGR